VADRPEERQDLALRRAEVRLASIRSSTSSARQRRRAASARAIVLLPLAMNPTR
jgi:hypothetical protein